LIALGYLARAAGVPEAQVDYDARTVTVRVDVETERGVRILTHEVGHVFLHGLTGRRNHLWQLQLELEAEVFCREALQLLEMPDTWKTEGQPFIDALHDGSHIYAQAADSVQRTIISEPALALVFKKGTLPRLEDLTGDWKSILEEALAKVAAIHEVYGETE
jgi:hypothetical protein